MLRIAKPKPTKIQTAENERIYAIGDIHGRFDLLKNLLRKIQNHIREDRQIDQRIRILFLGDVIDRGPNSLRCLELVAALCSQGFAELIKGNHEDLFLRSMAGDPLAQETWLKHGGLETVKSLGLVHTEELDSFDFGDVVRDATPKALITLLESAPEFLRSGDYLFCHAGVKPGVAIKRQDPKDMFLVRETFTRSKRWHGAMIVHGHSISEEVDFQSNRIGVDTGAYRSGRLSCICLRGTKVDVLTATAS